jgi:hypothetical protein
MRSSSCVVNIGTVTPTFNYPQSHLNPLRSLRLLRLIACAYFEFVLIRVHSWLNDFDLRCVSVIRRGYVLVAGLAKDKGAKPSLKPLETSDSF